jgi:hypothetical protein
MGGAFAGGKHAVDDELDVGDVVTVAPEVQSPWVLLLMPLGVALTYALLAAWNGNSDLGRRLG